MEQYGNTSTFNVESVLSKNATGSEYWRRTASRLASVDSVVDQIYFDVDHLEPWMAGRASRGASAAFCLLHRLGELAPTEAEVGSMLRHQDSPYIRAVALLYVRFVANPRALWRWFENCLEDGEELSPSPTSAGGGGEEEAATRTVTVGAFARELLLDPFYFETIFPRIPKPVADDVEARLRSQGLPTRALGNAGLGGPCRRGGAAQPSSVKSALMVGLAPSQRRAPGSQGGGGGGGGGDGGGGSRGGRRDGGERCDRDRGRDGGDGRRGDSRSGGGRDGERSSYRRSRSRSRSPTYRRRDDDRDRDRDRYRDTGNYYRGGGSGDREGYRDRR